MIVIDTARLEIERPLHCRYGAGSPAACPARITASVFGACAASWVVTEKNGVYTALCPEHVCAANMVVHASAGKKDP